MTSEEKHQLTPGEDVQKSLNKRLEAISWGLFLIMIGGIGLVPHSQVPEGTWLIGTGLIMLGLNAARYLKRIPMSSFTIVLGLVAVGVGASNFVGVELPFFPILLIIIGVGMLLKPLVERKPS